MKQKLIVVGLLIAGMAILLLVYVRNPQNDKVDAKNIFNAAQTYTREMRGQGRTVPDSVNMKDLIALGLLKTSDVAGFSGADVTIYLTANPNDPVAVLMRARFQDGQEMLVLGDGSIRAK